MTTVNIKGYDIAFPYSVPYDIQKAYMEKVLTCLDQKTHAVLESPTGTGKTLCLFAPVTAWAKQKKLQGYKLEGEHLSKHCEQNDQEGKWGRKTRSKIWYTSRTHSQITQTVSEVKKCNTDGLRVRVMGARDQLCINKLVYEEKDSYVKTIKCKELVKNKQCRYYTKLSYEKDLNKYYGNEKVVDIENLKSIGEACGVCPYFLAKKAAETADIVLLPYNYIIDKDSREANSIYLQDDIIIFDEGHNIPNSCEESYEFSFSSLELAIGIKNIKELMMSLKNLADTVPEDSGIPVATHSSNCELILEVLIKLESKLDQVPNSNELLPVSWLYDFFENTGISEETQRKLVDGVQLLKNDSSQLTIPGRTLETLKLLEKMMNVVFGQTVRSFDKATIERSFKCGISSKGEFPDNVKRLSLFCFNPSFGIKSLLELGVQSIIITSGTLSPLKTFISELGLPNPITLENGHIAKKFQVPFVILSEGVNKVRMDGTFKNRHDSQYVSSLGMTLTNLISSVPDGVLLLFPSYTMMEELTKAWNSDLGIWTRLNCLKRVFVESRNADEFINCMENYKRAIDSGNGAVFMGVLRGKIAEGIDYKDQYCRGVFIIGVPFPSIKDLRVRGKEKYSESLTVFNQETKREEKVYNNSYMSVEAMKATNQAIGRVIRHGRDYGVIVLVDYRFEWHRLFHSISGWLRGDAPVEMKFPATKKLIRDFFRDIHSGKLGIEEIRCQKVDSNGTPVACQLSYEKYDHKKHASQQVTGIKGSSENSTSRAQGLAKPRGHCSVEFVDEESPQDLFSMYKHSGVKVFQGDADHYHSGSLLDVLENSRSSSVGYREFDKSNKGKRKFEEDENSAQNSNPPSPPVLIYPETTGRVSTKKFSRLKVRPVVPFEAENPGPDVSATPEAKANGEGEDLKIQLVNYYKEVRQAISKGEDDKFKSTSCSYMKGQAVLADVIELMDEFFLIPGKKNLFAGFGICVKEKDKRLWKEACRDRGIESI